MSSLRQAEIFSPVILGAGLVAGGGVVTMVGSDVVLWDWRLVSATSLAIGLLVLAFAGFREIRLASKREETRRKEEEAAKATAYLDKVAEQRERERQEALEAEIREEKRRLDERIPCEGPSCTTGWWEGRTKHIAAKRDMWDLDGKAVSIECFRGSMRRDPIPGEDKRAFPPQSFAKEQATLDAKDKQNRARSKYILVIGLGGSEEKFRTDMQDPSRSDEDRLRSKEALDGLLKAKADSGDFDVKAESLKS
jgi:hypothetical protein